MRAQAPKTGPSTGAARRPRRAARAALWPTALALWPLALAVLVAGPLLGRGYLLLRDAVSTPRSFLTDAALGVSDAAPRAVPQDVVVAALSSVVDGGIVVKAVLVLALWAAGTGASAMVGALVPARGPGLRAAGLAGQCTASTLAVWNPYVAERLLQGHWSLLTGYAALPWLVWAGVRMRRAPAVGIGATLLALALAGLTPTGAVLGVIVAVVVAGMPGGWRRAARVAVAVAGFAAVAAPWLITAAVAGPGTTSDPAGVGAFAARAEPYLATIGSLAGLGGIWNAQAVPPSRTGAGALLGTLALLALVACGVRGVWRRRAHPVIAAVAVLAVLAVALPALSATAPGSQSHAGRWTPCRARACSATRKSGWRSPCPATRSPQHWVCARSRGCRGACRDSAHASHRIGAGAGARTCCRRSDLRERVRAPQPSRARCSSRRCRRWRGGSAARCGPCTIRQAGTRCGRSSTRRPTTAR